MILLYCLIDKPGQPIGLTTSVLLCDNIWLAWQQHLFDDREESLIYQYCNEQYNTRGLICGDSYNISVTSLLCEIEKVYHLISSIDKSNNFSISKINRLFCKHSH